MELTKKITKLVLVLSLVLIPQLSFAVDQEAANAGYDFNDSVTGQAATPTTSGCGIPKNIGDLFNYALCILDGAVIPFLIGIGLVIFLAGVVKFVAAGDNEEKRQGGRDMMIFGIIALFVMVSVWGFVNILSNSFFGKNSEIQSLPKKSTTIFAPN